MNNTPFDAMREMFIDSIKCDDKEAVAETLKKRFGDNFLELKRNNLFRYHIFKLMNYIPHEAQRKFHDAVPWIEEVESKPGRFIKCEHKDYNFFINPKDPTQSTRICKSCKAEYKNLYYNRFKCVIAAARWGKSLAVGKEGCLPLLWPGINADGSLNREKSPRAYVYGPSYSVGRHEFNYLVQGMEELGFIPVRYQNSPNTGNLYARWKWGAEVAVKSWDNPKSILGDEIDVALFAEASTLPTMIFERYIRARMGSRMAYGILGSTPHGIGEFLENYYYRGQDPKDIEVWSDSFSIMSNPHHPREDIEQARATLDHKTFNEQYLGKFTSMAGLVFDTFDRDLHVKKQIQKREQLPEGCQVVFSIDFGSTAPTGALMGYWDKDGCFHMIGEYYVAGQTIKHHFKHYLKDWLLKWQPEWMVYDFQQVDAAQFLQDEISVLEEKGEVEYNRLKMIPCKKGKKTGIERVRQLLHYNPKTEKCLLEIDPSCENMVYEFNHYANKKAPDGRILDEPAPGNDHLCDALEYVVATSYEDAAIRQERLNEKHGIEQKPAKQIHQLMMESMREQAEDYDHEIEQEAQNFDFGDEHEPECYVEWEGY